MKILCRADFALIWFVCCCTFFKGATVAKPACTLAMNAKFYLVWFDEQEGGYCQLIIYEIVPPRNRALSRSSGRNLGARDLLPNLKSSLTGDPLLSGFQTMAARAEEIVDMGVNREKALCLAG